MRFRGILAGLSAAAIWGGLYVVSKAVMAVIPPFTLLTLRLVIGVLVLWPFVRRCGGLGFDRSDWRAVLGVGAIGFGVSIGLQFVGTDLSTAANGAVVTAATPAFALLFAAWLLGEPITPRRLLALAVATVGVLMVVDPRRARLDATLLWGNLALVGAALTWALYSVLVRKVTRALDTLSVSLVALLGGLPVAVPMAFWEVAAQGVGTVTLSVLLGVLYVGVISTAVAMFLWNYAFASLEAGDAALTFFAQPVVGVALGAVFLGEHLSLTFLLGSVWIALGMYLASRQGQTGW